MSEYSYVCSDPVLHIVSASKARELGMKYYFTGKPCKRGHFSIRDVRSNTCQQCDKERLDKYNQENREYIREKKRKWIAENKEHVIKQRKKYQQDNKEIIAKKKSEYHQRNKEYISQQNKKWRDENKEYVREYNKKYWQENKERLSEYNKRYYQDNAEQCKARERRYYEENRDKILDYQKAYREENKEYIALRSYFYYYENQEAILEQSKKYIEENRDIISFRRRARYHERSNDEEFIEKRRQDAREYHNRKKDDPNYIAIRKMRGALRRILLEAGSSKTESTCEMLGYSREDFKTHIEGLFVEGMTWDNIHVDHLYPVSRYISDGVEDPSVINCLSNLAPMYIEDNLSKGTKTLDEWLSQKGESSREWELYSRLLNR